MRFPFFASFIVFIIWLTYQLTRVRRLEDKQKKGFWEREAEANRTRKKPLDDLSYIQIPFSLLPKDILLENPEAEDCLRILKSLSDQKIVNLTGLTNTDLKLRYGAPNISLLIEYDQNYTLLARTLQKWAVLLYENGYMAEAKTVLEFAVSTHTDVSGSYRLLASIYKEEGHPEKLSGLLHVAEQLNSVMKNPIVRILQESDQ